MRRAAWLAAGLGLALSACAPGAGSNAPGDAPASGSGAPSALGGGPVVDLPLAGGGVERLWYRQPERPAAVVILFAGADGVLALEANGRIGRLEGNFLLRMRETWLARDLAVAIPDVPSGRFSTMGAGDIDVLRAVIAHIRTRTDAPIWLVGTSMGSVRAAYGAAGLRPDEYAGLVLTSSVSRPSPRNTRTVFGANLDKVAVPTLILSHSSDGCAYTPPADADEIRKALKAAPRTEVMMVQGGSPPRSDACEAYAQHGFLGIETQVVDRIATWIKTP